MGDPESEQKVLLDILLNPSAEAEELPLSLLKKITKTFSEKLIIGEGTFGVVYKGELQNGMKVAVKKLRFLPLDLDDKNFYADVSKLKKLKHENIVRFLGYCAHSEMQEIDMDGKKIIVENRPDRLLCFEFVPNGTIPKGDARQGLEWTQRYQIIKGICHGLEYIHNAGYIHLDLKPVNILLDTNMVPKITDFGLSKFFGYGSTRNTSNNNGTYGYMAPEYVEKGTVSMKADIFSLGAVIFDIVTGSKGPEFDERKGKQIDDYLLEELTIWNRKLKCHHRGRSLEQAYQQVETCIKIALNCTDKNRKHRRKIKEIAQIVDMALDPNITEAVFEKDMDSLKDMDVHLDKPWVLLSMSSGSIEILDYHSKESCRPTTPVSKSPVHCAKFNYKEGEGWDVVAGDDLGVMHVYSLRGRWPFSSDKNFVEVKRIDVTPDGRGIRSLAVHRYTPHVLVSTGSSVMVWNTKDWTCIRMHHGPGYFKTVTHASFNTNDGRIFATGCCDGTVKLWCYEYSVGSLRRPHLEFRNNSGPICSISYFTCNDVCFLVTGSMDKTAKVWKYNEELPKTFGHALESIIKPEATLEHTDGVTATCYNPKLKTIITGTNDGVVSLWCSETYRRERILCFGLGRIFAVASSLTTGTRIFISHDQGFTMVDIYPKQQL